MLDIQLIRADKDRVLAGLAKKHAGKAVETLEAILTQDQQRREIIVSLENQRKEMNDTAKSIGMLLKSGKSAEAEEAKNRTGSLKANIKSQEAALQEIEVTLHDLLVTLPNLPHESVPEGKGASHRPKTTGSLGILIVGIGGRHGSCLLAAILAHRLEIQWCGPKGEPRQPNYYGCLTQLDYYQQKVKGLANVTMAAVGGWVSEQCGWQWC